MKKFLISIDTEGDNFWEWTPDMPITTRNSAYIPRFQKLCNKYGFKPTYLTNYEMLCDEVFVSFAKETLNKGNCEIGMHLHAWNTPPIYNLKLRDDIKPGDCAFLTEYPEEYMQKKINFMTEEIETKFGVRPIVHRAGRWTTNKIYFNLLNQAGYIADCSVTPGMDMTSSKGFTENSCGSDYTKCSKNPYIINETNILEIPMTVRENHMVKKDGNTRLRHRARNIYKAAKGRGTIWLRPNGNNLDEMLYLANKVFKEKNTDYLMFMLHTSEMMPCGSPTFRTENEIEKLYEDLEYLFKNISENYIGCTIGEYAKSMLE